jgi:hypothetical protein
MLDGEHQLPPERTWCEIVVRYVFIVFLAAAFFYLLPDKSEPRLQHEYDPELTLIRPEDYHGRRCQPVIPSRKSTKFAEKLTLLAQELDYPVLTAAHVGYTYCLLVTRLLSENGTYQALLNPAIVSVEGPHYAKIQSILCKRTIQRKKLYTRLRFTHKNFMEDMGITFPRACPNPECAAQLFQSFEILNGTFRCS